MEIKHGIKKQTNSQADIIIWVYVSSRNTKDLFKVAKKTLSVKEFVL